MSTEADGASDKDGIDVDEDKVVVERCSADDAADIPDLPPFRLVDAGADPAIDEAASNDNDDGGRPLIDSSNSGVALGPRGLGVQHAVLPEERRRRPEKNDDEDDDGDSDDDVDDDDNDVGGGPPTGSSHSGEAVEKNNDDDDKDDEKEALTAPAATDTDLEGWFREHGLLYADHVASALDEWGVACVEHLKLLPRESFLALFDDGKFVVREIAKLAFADLSAAPVDLKRCEPVAAQATSGHTKGSTSRRKKRGRGCPLGRGLQERRPGTTAVPGATPDRRRRLAYKDDPLLDGTVRLWSRTGHQTNLLRLSVANALRGGCGQSTIARNVRARVFGPLNGTASSDVKYQSILSVVSRISYAMKSGKLDDLSIQNGDQESLMSKSVRSGARGRKLGTKIRTKKSKSPEVTESDAKATHPDTAAEV